MVPIEPPWLGMALGATNGGHKGLEGSKEGVDNEVREVGCSCANNK